MRLASLAFATICALSTPAFAASNYALLDGQNHVVNTITSDDDLATVQLTFPNAVVLADPGGVGSTYDPVGRKFTAATRVGNPEVSVVAYEERFTLAEREAIRASTDPKVIDGLELLKRARTVLLNAPDVSQYTNYLESSGLIAAGRAAQILAF